MATFTVTTLADENDGIAVGGVSLREAIDAANMSAGADTIRFEDGLDGTIDLSTLGEIAITDNVVIGGDTDGDDFGNITVSGGDTTRLFNVDTADVTIEDMRLTEGATSDGSGGGAILHQSGFLSLENVTLSDNNVTGDGASGGAIRSSGDFLTLVNVGFDNNTAVRAGGAVELDSGADLGGSSVFMTGNDVGDGPGNGGAVHVTGAGSDVVFNSSDFSNNSASSEGGALWNDAGSFMGIYNTVVLNNFASGDGADNGGGGIFNNGGTMEIVGTLVQGNAADGAAGSGGGVFSTDGSVLIDESDINGNVAARAGGGLEVIDGDVFVENSSMISNIAGDSRITVASPGNGGAIHVSGTEGTVVEVNDSTFVGNDASSEGGALWNQAGSTMAVLNSLIVGNTASGDGADNGGGGLFNNGGTLDVFNTTVASNDADGAAGSGGGLLSVDGDVTITASTLDDNIAARAGGGIEVIDGTVDIVDTRLSNNITGDSGVTTAAPGNGGALHVTGMDGTVVNVTGSAVTGNFASAEGGGLWNQAGSTMNVSSTVFSENVARGDDADMGGGALFNNGGTLNVETSVLNNNVADGAAGSGGALHTIGGNVTVDNTTFRGNDASRAGGAAEVTAGRVISTNNVYEGNGTSANPGNGGAVHIAGMGTTFIANDDEYADNTAANQGGGVWVGEGSSAVVRNGTLTGNEAEGPGGGGAFYVVDGGDLTVNASVVLDNEAGVGEAVSVGSAAAPMGNGNIVFNNNFIADDAVVGSSNGDTVRGDGFGNTIMGEGGNDFLNGRDGDDMVMGGAGNDTVAGGAGDDMLSGGEGDDRVFGDFGDDTMEGGAGDDSLFGRSDDDVMMGGEGNDILVGGAGDDMLFGGEGSDTLQGGGGEDTFVIGAMGPARVADFNDGMDVFGLTDGLMFEDLSFTANRIEAGGETIATVVGFSTNSLTEDDFVLV